MTTSFESWNRADYLVHYGIPGMKWGVRRYMNADGTLTNAGRKRYAEDSTRFTSKWKMQRDYRNLDKGKANAIARQVQNNTEYRDVHKGLFGGMKNRKEAHQKAESNATNAGYVRSIEGMQSLVLNKAARRGFTINSKEVTRKADIGRKEVTKMLDGKIGNYSYESVRNESQWINVRGSEIHLKKKD